MQYIVVKCIQSNETTSGRGRTNNTLNGTTSLLYPHSTTDHRGRTHCHSSHNLHLFSGNRHFYKVLHCGLLPLNKQSSFNLYVTY